MSTRFEGKYAAEFLLSEGNGSISREQVVIAAAAPAMVAGTVLGRITASGKFTAYNNANSDGTQTAVGVLYEAVPDSTSDQKAVAILRYAEVQQSELTGYDAAAKSELEALGIIVR